MIIEKFITNATSTYGIDNNTAQVDWIAFSDSLLDFGRQIAYQGIATSMLAENGKANGWLTPGSPYILGNDYNYQMFAGAIDVTDRQVIRGNGDGEFNFSGNTITLVNPTPTSVIIAWKVSQKFSTKNPKNLTSQQPTETDPFTFAISTEYSEERFIHDIVDNRTVENSAGVPFNPPPTIKVARQVYTITRKEWVNPLAKIRAFQNTVNSEIYYGAAVGTMLMEEITANIASGDENWTVTYKMKENLDTWTTYILDCGFDERTEDGTKKILLDDNTPPSEPVKLNGQGQKLDGDGFYELEFKQYQMMPFSQLNLPNLGTY